MVHFRTLDRGMQPLRIRGTFRFRGDRVERSVPQVLPTLDFSFVWIQTGVEE